jgi:hypothetical protein
MASHGITASPSLPILKCPLSKLSGNIWPQVTHLTFTILRSSPVGWGGVHARLFVGKTTILPGFTTILSLESMGLKVVKFPLEHEPTLGKIWEVSPIWCHLSKLSKWIKSLETCEEERLPTRTHDPIAYPKHTNSDPLHRWNIVGVPGFRPVDPSIHQLQQLVGNISRPSRNATEDFGPAMHPVRCGSYGDPTLLWCTWVWLKMGLLSELLLWIGKMMIMIIFTTRFWGSPLSDKPLWPDRGSVALRVESVWQGFQARFEEGHCCDWMRQRRKGPVPRKQRERRSEKMALSDWGRFEPTVSCIWEVWLDSCKCS